MAMKFSLHSSFPAKRAFTTAGGLLWKIQVREWAFAQVNLEGITDSGIGVTSNNPDAVADERDKPHKALKFALDSTGKKGTAKFYAKKSGFSFVQPFLGDPWVAAEDLRLQVEVIQRRSAQPKDLSLTKLTGTTIALNAPDAKAYTMDKTVTFDPNEKDPTKWFAGVPAKANHVVISSHGGVVNHSDSTNPAKICLFISGFTTAGNHIDVENAKAAFSVLIGKVAPDCVVWFGGCTIGANTKFCQIAADASGCIVVAPVMPLPFRSFAKGQVEILDGFAVPKIYVPQVPNGMSVWEFCATQESRNFEVPV